MYVLMTERVVRMPTGNTSRFSPRHANRIQRHVSGPMRTLASAQRAMLACLATTTCLSAQIWTEQQVREVYARGYAGNGDELQSLVMKALRLIESQTPAMEEDT